MSWALWLVRPQDLLEENAALQGRGQQAQGEVRRGHQGHYLKRREQHHPGRQGLEVPVQT